MNKPKLSFKPVNLIVYEWELKPWLGDDYPIEIIEMTLDLVVDLWVFVNGEHPQVLTASSNPDVILIGSDSQDKFNRFFAKLQDYTDEFNRSVLSERKN